MVFNILKDTVFDPEKFETTLSYRNARAGSTKQNKNVVMKYTGEVKFAAMVEVSTISQFMDGDMPTAMCKAAVEGEYANSPNNQIFRAAGLFLRDLSQEAVRRNVAHKWYMGDGPNNHGGVSYYIESDNNGEVKRKVHPSERWNIGVENNMEYGNVSMRLKLGKNATITDARTGKALTLDEAKAFVNPFRGALVDGKRVVRTLMNRAYSNVADGEVVRVDPEKDQIVRISPVRAYVQFTLKGWFNIDLKGEFCSGLIGYVDALELGAMRGRYKWMPSLLATKYGPTSDDDVVLDSSMDWYKAMMRNCEAWKRKNPGKSSSSSAFAAQLEVDDDEYLDETSASENKRARSDEEE